ncbi:hypothetical protein BBAD15_g1445 [Beauveria bassiana D1-5]|uniref:Uncharacterized protein n=1 Tax=Beauveria bassiana D1-5 TaxID=1245745 RepID=A0A0A2W2E0_BEABA|nr:hypothetical protein BBAD15_g1445 [Beauveria bassiana D1-5]
MRGDDSRHVAATQRHPRQAQAGGGIARHFSPREATPQRQQPLGLPTTRRDGAAAAATAAATATAATVEAPDSALDGQRRCGRCRHTKCGASAADTRPWETGASGGV